MSQALPAYELCAIRYATRDGMRRDHFLMGDPHDAPMPMDYFVWVARAAGRTVVIDTGFTRETADKRRREFLRCPVESLRMLGVDPEQVEDVIITHLHYDHAGNFERFARARIHLQEKEMLFAAGRHMRHRFLAHAYEVEDIVALVRANFDGRVRMHQAAAEVAPGLTIHPVGGHTPGMQFVRVHTRRGWVVLASDATHFYENLERGRPFPAVVNVPETFDAFERLIEAAPSPEHIVPGHDPIVMRKYKAPSRELEGIAVDLTAPMDR